MRIVICAKEVLDPDAVNNYALAGRLEIGEDGKTLTQTAIPRLMNAYDEQAIEAALRLRDAGADCTISVVSAGPDQASLLKHAAALGADEIAAIYWRHTSAPVGERISFFAGVKHRTTIKEWFPRSWARHWECRSFRSRAPWSWWIRPTGLRYG
jgi:hypothetical protein